MNNEVMKFGYEDTDKKIEIEIYGLIFEIKNINKKNVEELKNIDKNLDKNLEKEIENILGAGAVEKINNKRKQDGYEVMDLEVELNLLGCIFETYANATIGNLTNKITNTVQSISNRVNELNNINRNQRRNYNKRYNRKYRRY